MTFKRQVDRLPIIPADATEHNVTCHYCIVGCGYKAYTWDMNKQGGTAPNQNKFNVNLAEQQSAETVAWIRTRALPLARSSRTRRRARVVGIVDY